MIFIEANIAITKNIWIVIFGYLGKCLVITGCMCSNPQRICCFLSQSNIGGMSIDIIRPKLVGGVWNFQENISCFMWLELFLALEDSFQGKARE